MLEARALCKHEHIWAKARLATEQNRLVARQAVALMAGSKDKQLAALQDNAALPDAPGLHAQPRRRRADHLALAAWPPTTRRKPPACCATPGPHHRCRPSCRPGSGARSGGSTPGAAGRRERGLCPGLQAQARGPWSDELLAAAVRAALRAATGPAVLQAIGRMSAAEQRQPAWQFWRAHPCR